MTSGEKDDYPVIPEFFISSLPIELLPDMTSKPSASAASGSQPNAPKNSPGIIAAASIAVIATVFSVFFLMGLFSTWLKGEWDWLALVVGGLKVGASGSLGVLCIGLSAKSWQRLPVPSWLPSTASFAVGFFVMNGLGEVFEGRYESILPKAGSGFLLGACVGLGIYLAQKKALGPQGRSETSDQSASAGSGN